MSDISAINSNLYPTSIDSISPIYTGRTSLTAIEPVKKNYDEEYPPVDLSDYYSNVKENVVQSANVLDNAMVEALQNGYSVQDACNIKLAEIAYKANCYVLKSTFELKI